MSDMFWNLLGSFVVGFVVGFSCQILSFYFTGKIIWFDDGEK